MAPKVPIFKFRNLKMEETKYIELRVEAIKQEKPIYLVVDEIIEMYGAKYLRLKELERQGGVIKKNKKTRRKK